MELEGDNHHHICHVSSHSRGGCAWEEKALAALFKSRVKTVLCCSVKGQRVVSSLGSAWAIPYLPCESFSGRWMVTYQSGTPLLG